MKGIVVLVALLLMITALSATLISDPAYIDFVFEISVVILLAVVVVNLNQIGKFGQQYKLLYWGFLLFLFAKLVDSVDELFDYPELFKLVFEDALSLISLSLIIIGVRRWLKVEREKAKKLLEMATTDPLTGAYNRRYFVDIVANKGHGALLIMDLDHFKKINDNFGHQAGDDSLKAFVSSLKSTLNGDTLLARWGGEEFILFVENAEQLKSVAETVLATTRKIKVPHEQGELSFTVSIGAAPLTDYEFKKALAVADEKLYQAKTQGRDRAVI